MNLLNLILYLMKKNSVTSIEAAHFSKYILRTMTSSLRLAIVKIMRIA